MANDIVSRDKNGNSTSLLLLMPLVFILIIFIIGLGNIKYHEIKFKIITKEIYRDALDASGLETTELMKNFIINKYKDYKYDENDITIHLIQKDGKLLLFSYYTYDDYLLTVKNTVKTFIGKMFSGGKSKIITSGSRVYLCSLKGYYNKHKETVIEDYEINNDDTNSDAQSEDIYVLD